MSNGTITPVEICGIEDDDVAWIGRKTLRVRGREQTVMVGVGGDKRRDQT